MAGDWHYINYGNGVEELYNLEKDPMEWENLVSSGIKKHQKIVEHLKSFIPENTAEPIPESKKDKTVKKVDITIKEKRDLNTLR